MEVDLSFEACQVTGLIGPNGSGKTTLFNLLSGYYTPSAGTIYFQDTDITKLTPVDRVDLGISRSFQLVSIFANMALYENLVLPDITLSRSV
jgi:branched-chain amino acid transport system ATP-binding protein